MRRQQQFWVQLPDAKLKLAQSFEKTPYEPMYTELVGHLAPPDSIGYSAGYAAKFVVDNINYLTSFKYSLCGNSPTPTRAFGSEPNWSISFAPNSANIKIDGQPEHSYKVFCFISIFFQARLPTRARSVGVNKKSMHERSGRLFVWLGCFSNAEQQNL